MISIPFIGSKRYSYKQVKEIAEKKKYKNVYEPFGGSCMLSVNLLNDGLVEDAYVNDYDHFFDNYEHYLDLKDQVVAEGYRRGLERTSHDSKRGKYVFQKDGSIKPVKSTILQGEKRQLIQDIFEELVPEEYYRYFTIGNNFCHSGTGLHKKIYLRDFCMFNAYLKTDKQREYLEKLNECEITNLDYRDFLLLYEYEIDKDALLIVDPPYVGTLQDHYKHTFTEEDTVELINTLNKLPCDYIFFNSDIEKIIEWLDGTEYEIKPTGNGRVSPTHHTVEYLIYVKKNES